MTDMLPEDPAAYCFIDTETRGPDLKRLGVDAYAQSVRVIMVQYAIGDGPVHIWAPDPFEETLRWADAPRDLLDFMARMYRNEGWMVAANSRFDRIVMNRGMVKSRAAAQIPVRCMLDASAQASAANLPGRLDGAHKGVGGTGKLPDGRALISLFCSENSTATPETHPEEWQRFRDYGVQDVEAVREVFQNTRALTIREWEQFWASEVINDRGLPMDRPLMQAAAALSDEYMADVQDRVKEYTREACYSVNQHIALAGWVYDHLSHLEEAADILTKVVGDDEDGRPAKISLDRERVTKLIALLNRLDEEQGLTDEEWDVLQLLEVREFGASNTPKKFAKALPMLVDDRLRGQYVYNGAQQTGRFSSRGLQVHNLTGDTLPDEEGAIIDLMGMHNGDA